MLREDQRKKVLVVSCDVYRPAAIEQLRAVAAQVDVEFFPSRADQKPVDIALAAKDHARTHYHDVLIVDTAGRLAVDQAMMDEIRDLHKAIDPVETLFVVDAMQGQDAVNVAKAFNDVLPLTGVVLTKVDGDARGGATLSVRHVTGKPVKFVGMGEKLANLEPFHPERMASRILGMGDVLSLVEEARKNVDMEQAEKLAKKVKSGKGFDLEDFKQQMLQMRKMGGLSALMDKLPAAMAAKESQVAHQRLLAGPPQHGHCPRIHSARIHSESAHDICAAAWRLDQRARGADAWPPSALPEAQGAWALLSVQNASIAPLLQRCIRWARRMHRLSVMGTTPSIIDSQCDFIVSR